jgi:hypothetical protein
VEASKPPPKKAAVSGSYFSIPKKELERGSEVQKTTANQGITNIGNRFLAENERVSPLLINSGPKTPLNFFEFRGSELLKRTANKMFAIDNKKEFSQFDDDDVLGYVPLYVAHQLIEYAFCECKRDIFRIRQYLGVTLSSTEDEQFTEAYKSKQKLAREPAQIRSNLFAKFITLRDEHIARHRNVLIPSLGGFIELNTEQEPTGALLYATFVAFNPDAMDQ